MNLKKAVIIAKLLVQPQNIVYEMLSFTQPTEEMHCCR